MSGLPCSGKSTHARQLEASGASRVSVDEIMVESVGRLGIDCDRSDHEALLEPVVDAAREQVLASLLDGSDVVFDHGLGRRAERDEFESLAETSGAGWKLLCFEADIATLRLRCERRSEVPGTVPISIEVLDYLTAVWERPSGEGEIVIVTD